VGDEEEHNRGCGRKMGPCCTPWSYRYIRRTITTLPREQGKHDLAHGRSTWFMWRRTPTLEVCQWTSSSSISTCGTTFGPCLEKVGIAAWLPRVAIKCSGVLRIIFERRTPTTQVLIPGATKLSISQAHRQMITTAPPCPNRAPGPSTAYRSWS